MATTACKFSKIFKGRACPRTPLEPFFILNMLQNDSAVKLRLKGMSKLDAPSLKKFLNTPQT